jgi:hypothetical protein
MLVLFDHSTPAPLRYALEAHIVVEAIDRGWERLGNGALLDAAEAASFEIIVVRAVNGATPGSYTEVEIPVR